jgi:hypothetical protein
MSTTNNAIQISTHIFSLVASLSLLVVASYKVIKGQDVQTYLSIITFLSGLYVPSPFGSLSTVANMLKKPVEKPAEKPAEPDGISLSVV